MSNLPEPPSSNKSLESFLKSTLQRDDRNERFVLETPTMLELNFRNWGCYAKVGSMVATSGDLDFKPVGFMEMGLQNFLKRLFTNEGASLMKIEGSGRCYLADRARRIQLLHLDNEGITVNGNDLLAFDPTISFNIRMMKRVGGMLSAGLFNVELKGKGYVALCCHGQPLTLKVSRGTPLYTDPQATIAWSSSLNPDFSVHTNIGRILLGRTSGESVRMKFQGEGWVIVQPYEENRMRVR